MISADFYPTTYTYANGELELTDDIKNLMSTGNLGAPYYMGYISHDDYPECLKVKKVNFDGGLSYEPIESNHSWGFWYNRAAYNTSSRTTSYHVFQNGSDYLPASTSLNYCFINKVKMANVNYVNAVTINILGMYIPTANLDETGNTGFRTRVGSLYFEVSRPITSDLNVTNTISVDRLANIINGVNPLIESWTYSINNGQETVSRTFPDVYARDFNENGLLKVVCNEGDYMFIGSITNFDPIDRGAISYLNESQAQSIVAGVPTPFFESDTNGAHIIYNRGYQQYSDARLNYYFQLKVLRAPTNMYIEFNQENYCFDRFPEFKLSTFDIPNPSSMYNKSAVVDDDYFITPTGSGSDFYQFRIYPKHDLADIYKFLMYYHKIQLTANGLNQLTYNPTYTTDISVSLFNDNDQSVNNRVADDYANIEDYLRDWQQPDTNIAVNEYDPTDKPEYDPSGPGGDSDEGSIPLNTPGTLGATNTFVTRYVLNTTQIRMIGQQLWSTLGNGNEITWNNFFLTLSGSDKFDYSLTLSEVISYFVSLKYFPFSLNSVSSSTGENGIRVGTGASLIGAGSTTKTLDDSIVQLNGGRCTIPNKWSNYLDLEPYTTASLYVPYCGTMELPMSVIAGETIGITYLVDMTTGAMTAAVMKYSGSGAYFPIAVMNGSCGFDILMTGTNGNSQMTNAITNLASKSTQWVGQILQSGLTGLMGGVSGTDSTGMGALSNMSSTVMGIGQDMIQQNIQMPKLYATAPMTSGSSSSLSSLILPQTAYIQIRRHNPYRLSAGSSYKDELGLIGYRSAYQGLISSANGMGFVKCQNPNLAEVADAGATEAEINMIKSLLSDGIFT